MLERARNLSACSGSGFDDATFASVARSPGHCRVAAGGFRRLACQGQPSFPPSDGRRTVVPVHAGETIGPGLLSKILKDAEMDTGEFAK